MSFKGRTPGAAVATANAFFRRYLEDAEQGTPSSLDGYVAMYPGFEDVITSAWRRMHEDPESVRAAARDGNSLIEMAANAALVFDNLHVGERIGRYRIEHELGRGGQGRVYLARDEELGRDVAIKVLPLGASLERLRRLRREGEAAARIEDPGICSVYEVGESEAGTFVAMQYIAGRTLGECIGADDAPWAGASNRIDAVLALVERIAHSLQRLHDSGVVHRDLKPGNVMISHDGRPVLVDFGLAHVDDGGTVLTPTGDVLGTPGYMAPEQLSEDAAGASAATDVWSLGVILFECLFQSRPFEAPTRTSLIEAIRLAPVPASRLATLPRDVRTVVETMLEKDPARRYQSASAVAEDLRRLRAREPIAARGIGPWLRARRAVERRPVVATACALGLLLVVAVPSAIAIEARTGERALRVEADRAQRYLDQTLGVIERMLVQVSNDVLGDAPGATELRRALLKEARDEFERVAAGEGWPRGLRLRVAQVELGMARLAELVGQNGEARTLAISARDRLGSLESIVLDDAKVAALVADAQLEVVLQHELLGDLDDAERELAALREALSKRPDGGASWPLRRARVWERTALLQTSRGQLDVACESYSQALRLLESSETAHAKILIPELRVARGELLGRRDRSDEARAELSTAVDELKAALAAQPGDRNRRAHLSRALGCLGEIEFRGRRDEASLQACEEAERILLELCAEYPSHVSSRLSLRLVQARIISLLQRLDRAEEANDRQAALAATLEQIDLGTEPSAYELRTAIDLLVNLGFTDRKLAPERAELFLRRATALGDDLEARFPDYAMGRNSVAIAWQIVAVLCARRGAHSEAVAAGRAGFATLESIHAAAPSPSSLHDLAASSTQLGQNLLECSEEAAGLEALARGAEFGQVLFETYPGYQRTPVRAYGAARTLALALIDRGRWDEAAAGLERAMPAFLAFAATPSKDTARRWRKHPALARTEALKDSADAEVCARYAALLSQLRAALSADEDLLPAEPRAAILELLGQCVDDLART